MTVHMHGANMAAHVRAVRATLVVSSYGMAPQTYLVFGCTSFKLITGSRAIAADEIAAASTYTMSASCMCTVTWRHSIQSCPNWVTFTCTKLAFDPAKLQRFEGNCCRPNYTCSK